MIVCHCFCVSDREIRGCVREGATSVAEIGKACGAGTGCGGCRPEIARLAEGSEPITCIREKPAYPALHVLRTG